MRTVLMISPLLLLGACAGPLNTDSCIGSGMPTDSTWRPYCPSTITQSAMRELPEEAEPTVSQKAAPVYGNNEIVEPEHARPSITSLDRSGWAGLKLEVPNELSAHQPRYTKNVHLNETSRRARGEFPTTASALDTGTSGGNDEQIKEAIAAPFAAGTDMLLFPARAVMQARPQQPTRTGLEPYARTPKFQTIVPLPMTIVGEPTMSTPPAMTPLPYAPAKPGSPEGTPSGVQVPPRMPPGPVINPPKVAVPPGTPGPVDSTVPPKPSSSTPVQPAPGAPQP